MSTSSAEAQRAGGDESTPVQSLLAQRITERVAAEIRQAWSQGERLSRAITQAREHAGQLRRSATEFTTQLDEFQVGVFKALDAMDRRLRVHEHLRKRPDQ